MLEPNDWRTKHCDTTRGRQVIYWLLAIVVSGAFVTIAASAFVP